VTICPISYRVIVLLLFGSFGNDICKMYSRLLS